MYYRSTVEACAATYHSTQGARDPPGHHTQRGSVEDRRQRCSDLHVTAACGHPGCPSTVVVQGRGRRQQQEEPSAEACSACTTHSIAAHSTAGLCSRLARARSVVRATVRWQSQRGRLVSLCANSYEKATGGVLQHFPEGLFRRFRSCSWGTGPLVENTEKSRRQPLSKP